MNGKVRERWYPWELALLLSLCVTLLSGVRAGAESRALSEKVIRLHVIAVSDSEADQAVKLRVRDAVLAELAPALEGAADVTAAAETIRGLLPALEETARQTSGEAQVSVTLSREGYPTRVYDTFSLPAGQYTSLRVTLGAGRGHNWWCVVYPPLCTAAAEEELDETAALSGDDVKLLTEDGTGYVLRFRLVELWGELLARWG